jgi:hypothetical protein
MIAKMRDKNGYFPNIYYYIGFILLTLLLLTILFDFYYSKRNNSGFYISESFIFSLYWVLFIPILLVLLKFINQSIGLFIAIIYVSLTSVIHILTYPFLIKLASFLFLDHSYYYRQVFDYAVTQYAMATMIIYGLATLIFYNLKKKTQDLVNPLSEHDKPSMLTSILVTDADNTKHNILVKEIDFFEANSPYVLINRKNKKYVISQTLKSLEDTIDNKTFVRIHKSYILNINALKHFKSRSNGDYDITLYDNRVLRLSRSYVSKFKQILKSK